MNWVNKPNDFGKPFDGRMLFFLENFTFRTYICDAGEFLCMQYNTGTGVVKLS